MTINWKDAKIIERYFKGARVYNSVNQLTESSIWLTLSFNCERYDNDNIHTNVLANRLTCKTNGIYIISLHIHYEFNPIGERRIGIWYNNSFTIAQTAIANNEALDTHLSLTTIYKLTKNDYIEAKTIQTSGINLNVISYEATSPEFAMQKIG